MVRQFKKIDISNCKTILLVNPSKYLGNLLLAGALIQAFHRYCESQNIRFYVVLDESFRPLMQGAFPEECVFYYPRKALNQATVWSKLGTFLSWLGKLRAIKTDLAFNIEEDTMASRLTQLSGARLRLGCSPKRHRWGYEEVLPVEYVKRPSDRAHRWYSYYEVFASLGMPEPEPAYLALQPQAWGVDIKNQLKNDHLDFSRPLIIIHASATKAYKQWPIEHFSLLIQSIINKSWQVVLIGAGPLDREINTRIKSLLADVDKENKRLVDLCDRLSLPALACLFSASNAVVGNDSGPVHLAAAMGRPGVVLFGPTDRSIWSPLGNSVRMATGTQACDPRCKRSHCVADYRCMRSINPDLVFKKLSEIIEA